MYTQEKAQASCLYIGLFALLISFVMASAIQAQQLVLEETYDNLPLGSVVPNWKAVVPGKDPNLPVVQNVSFKSAPHGIKVANDFEVVRPLDNPLEGTVTIELWMNPKKGSDTNSFLRLVLENETGRVLVGKNDSDRWLYQKADVQTFFKPVEGQGHNIKVVYKTSTATYDLFFDGGLIDSNVPIGGPGAANKRVTGINLHSGRGGSRTTSYFDDLRVSVTTPSPPPLLPPAEPIVLNETYDGLSPGTPLPDWTPGVFAQRDAIPPGGGAGAAKITWNIPSAYRDFPLLRGIVTVEVWMKPKKGSDTNHGLHLGNSLGGDYNKDVIIVHKNDQDKWWYSEAGAPVSFANYDGNWHHFRVVYNTATNRYTLYMDGTLIKSDIPCTLDLSGGISHVGMNSGRWGRAPDTTSYFDELKVYGVIPRVINISINPASIDFGTVTVGQSSEKTVTITNQSTSTGTLTGSVGSLSSPFAVVNGGGSFSLERGQSREVKVRFSPQAAGSASATLSITHNATNQTSPTNVPLSGTAGGDDHPNQPPGTPIAVDGTRISGRINPPGDVDYFNFSATGGRRYVIETHGNMDAYLYLYATDGITEIDKDDDDGEGANSRIEWQCPNNGSGTYYVKVRHYNSTATGEYSLSITEEITKLRGDVNEDGIVDIKDIMIVAENFRQPKIDPRADVNKDGVVDISDLILVDQDWGKKAAPHQLSRVGYKELLEHWLIEARAVNDGSETFRRGIAVLEQFLRELVPKQTTLLQNFPNPFNPETWIPYQLSKSSHVSITIYDASGKVVKRFDLGFQQAGMYQTRTRAAHWDGRNEVSESVASGVYFVELRAEKYQQTQRIVLLK